VHFHPWRDDGGLSYVVKSVRYAMVPPPPELATAMIAVARSRFTAPGWRQRLAGGPACGTFKLIVNDHCTVVWDAVIWSNGERSGVDLHCIAPPLPPATEPILQDGAPNSAAAVEPIDKVPAKDDDDRGGAT
jgi:hypothetical protein